MYIYLPLLICLLGGLIFFITDHPKFSVIGLHMFWVGLLAFLLKDAIKF